MAYRSTQILLMFVVFLVSSAGQVSVAQPVPQANSEVSAVTPSAGGWRRTSQGWQRSSNWHLKADRSSVQRAAKVHPLVLATLIGLISLGGLIGFAPQRRSSR